MASWKDLPDVEPVAAATSWRDLPDVADVAPDSPLAKALASQTGDVVTVETPTGPAQFDRQGNRIASQDEVAQQLDAGGAGLRQRMLEGALSFLSGGGPLVDEAHGVKTALKRSMATLAGRDAVDPVTAYRKGRDDARGLVAKSTADASPTVDVGGAELPVLPIAGALASSGPMAGGVVPRLVAAGFGSGLNAFGASEGETLSDVASDTAVGGALGGAGAAAGEVIGAASRPLAKALRKQSGLAADVVREAEKKAADKVVNSARGALGGETSSAMRTLEQARFAVDNPQLVSPLTLQNAKDFLASPGAEVLMNQTLQSTIARGAGQVPRLEKAKASLIDAFEAASPEQVAARAAEKLDPSKQGKDFAHSLWKSIGQRALISGAVGAAGAGASALTGNDPVKGGIGGLAGGAFLSQPGVLAFLRNQAGSPARQALINALAAHGAEVAGAGAQQYGRGVGAVAGRTRTDLTNEERRQLEALIQSLRGGQSESPTP